MLQNQNEILIKSLELLNDKCHIKGCGGRGFRLETDDEFRERIYKEFVRVLKIKESNIIKSSWAQLAGSVLDYNVKEHPSLNKLEPRKNVRIT